MYNDIKLNRQVINVNSINCGNRTDKCIDSNDRSLGQHEVLF